MSNLPERYQIEDPSKIRPLGNVEKDVWETLANLTVSGLTGEVFSQLQDYSNPLARIKLNLRPKIYSEMLEEMFLYEARLWRKPKDEPVEDGAFKRRNGIYSMIASEARRKRNYTLVPDMMSMLYDIRETQPGLVAETLTCSVVNLYLLLCEPNRFLVGTRNGIHWKDIEIPVDDEHVLNAPLDYIANYYLYLLTEIGKEELPVVPTRLIHPGLVSSVQFPTGLSPLEESLEDAYYDKEYDLDKEGARIALKNAGDIRSMLVLERGKRIWSKIATTYGEGLVVIDNEDGSWIHPSDAALIGSNEEDDWIRLVGEVYRDLVTQKNIPILDDDEFVPPKTITLDPSRPERLYTIYIPRRHYLGNHKFPRFKYEGPRRPPRLHKVKPHLRERPMTEEHKEELIRWEAETGFKVPKDIPSNKTFVRPHLSPSEADERLRELPIFVRSKIQRDMDEQIKELLKS